MYRYFGHLTFANGKLSGMPMRMQCNVVTLNPHRHRQGHRGAVSKNPPTTTELQNPGTIMTLQFMLAWHSCNNFGVTWLQDLLVIGLVFSRRSSQSRLLLNHTSDAKQQPENR